MLKAVFRANELVPLQEKVLIDTPAAFSDPGGLAPLEEVEELHDDVEVYSGPTADDLRREAEMFKSNWEEEKARMISSAQSEADSIITEAKNAAFQEVKRQTDEAQVMKQQAEEEAGRIIADAKVKGKSIENEIRQTLDAEKKDARDKGDAEGREAGFAEGKAEVERLIERTQTVLERAQNKRAEILNETEQQIVDLVLLIARKVIKVISENQRDIIIPNIIEALRKVKTGGDVIIRVNLADLKLATENKQYFISLMEGAKSIQVIEDSTVDAGGCIIETDFGEIDARISSQLAEIESKILEVSPVRSSMGSSMKGNIPQPVVRTANLNADLAASSDMLNRQAAQEAQQAARQTAAQQAAAQQAADEDDSLPDDPATKAALTASAALAAIATMSAKGKRDSDKELLKGLRKTDQEQPPPQ